MKNTRIYDRVPVKDVRVKDPQIGTRTPQILISRKGGEYLRGDVLDANATTELAKSIHMPDIDKINEKLEHTVNKDQIGQPNGVAGLDSTGNVPVNQLANIKHSTKESFGIVKVGDGLNVTDGTISVDPEYLVDMMSYGVEWDTTVADPACTRIGNPLYHKQLPIQSQYKGCLVKNGKVNY